MADPLSLTASILAVVGAAQAAAKGIRKIIALKNAPEQLLQIYNEVCGVTLDSQPDLRTHEYAS
jgi:hypothetical protein